MVKEAVETMGRIDVVVSNAGWTKPRNFMNLSDNVVEDDWDKCFNMNVKAHLFLAEAAKPHLEATEGAIITTSSAAGVRPSGSSIVRSRFEPARSLRHDAHLCIGVFCHKSGTNIPRKGSCTCLRT